MGDFYIYDLKKKEFATISPYLRARDPDASPDGKHVAYVANANGKNVLMTSDTNWQNLRIEFEPPGYARLDGPRFSPDGKSIAFQMRNEKTAGQDILVARDGEVESWISDGSANSGVVWTRDGKYLLYSSDRTGVNNLYAYEIGSSKTFQISHVLGGLFFPNVDPERKWIYAVGYRGKGYDVVRFPWNPATWTKVDSTKSVEPATSARFAPADVTSTLVPSEYRASRYLAPQYLRPALAFYNYTHQFGAQIAGTDPLFLKNYSVDLRYDTASTMPVGSLEFFDASHVVPWMVSLSHQETTGHASSTGLLTGELTFNIPLTTDSNSTYLRPGLTMAIPNSGTFASSYAPVGGPHLGIRYDTQFKDLGSSFYQSGDLVDLDLHQYFPVAGDSDYTTSVTGAVEGHRSGFFAGDTIHAGIQGAAILAGNTRNYAYFGVTGYESFPFNSGGSYCLYGYSSDRATRSPSLAVLNFTYVFPVSEIQRGFGVAPLYLGRLSLGLRTQYGAVGLPSGNVFYPWSYGAELSQDVVAGQVFGLTVRFGAYNAPRSLGGEFQTLLSISANDD
jgi:hypothetical protein